MAPFAFGLVDDDSHICFPREFAQLTHELILIGQRAAFQLARLISYYFVRMSMAEKGYPKRFSATGTPVRGAGESDVL